MNRKTIILAAIFTLCSAQPLFAHCGMCGVGEKKGESKAQATANTTCLCGMEITGNEAAHVEYNGKMYHFCSLGCAKHFESDPEGMLENIEE